MWKLLSGVFLGWSLGANDAANVFGTGVTTGMVRFRTAVALTSLFVILGAVLEGPKCIQTVGELSRVLPLEAFICALSAGLTMTGLTFLAVPASTSHAIVGAVIGAGIVSGTADFMSLSKIVLCWILTPIGGGVLGYGLHRAIGLLLQKTMKSLRLRNLAYTAGIVAAGCYGAYTLGANNVANVTGVYVGSGLLTPQIAALIGGLSIVTGVATYSRRVMVTVGKGIAPLDPFAALVAVLAEAITLHGFTQIGVPVSSSQAVVGAVAGVGLVGGVRTVSLKMLTRIGVSWVLTPVFSGLLAFVLTVAFTS
jgi:PiT family inorganic phosphate transporter